MGIDVGEDFLDLAILVGNRLRRARIALRDVGPAPITLLQGRLREACPDLGAGWIVAVDSPRLPRDLSLDQPWPARRAQLCSARLLDQTLRKLARRLDPPLRLSLFPTPVLDDFARQMAICDKPHLRAAFAALFPGAGIFAGGSGTALFTRFMLTGFLTFAALETTGARLLEAYPYLQWRLWGPLTLAPKRSPGLALQGRASVLRDLRQRLRVQAEVEPATLDQADAEILAASTILSARQGGLLQLRHRDEGAFLLAAKARSISPIRSRGRCVCG
jgi:hypothetical protein